jgi:hypothetical protein
MRKTLFLACFFLISSANATTTTNADLGKCWKPESTVERLPAGPCGIHRWKEKAVTLNGVAETCKKTIDKEKGKKDEDNKKIMKVHDALKDGADACQKMTTDTNTINTFMKAKCDQYYKAAFEDTWTTPTKEHIQSYQKDYGSCKADRKEAQQDAQQQPSHTSSHP